MRFQASKLSLLISGLFLASSSVVYADDAPKAESKTTDIGTITVQGEPGGTDTGLIQQEDTPKARSSVNREYIEKKGGTANPYQLISLLPGVSTADYDGTGLFGGSLRVRGFNSDQLGFTIDGVPVNDSGSFAVYPQEYIDPQNMCEIFVTQGSTDTDAPHVGASGGNIGLVTCDPQDKQRFRVMGEVGSHSLWESYARFDSGRFLNDKAKMFISFSKTDVNKFRGLGRGEKEHVDAKGRFDFGSGSYIDAGYLWNRQLNNNYMTLTKAQLAQYGWDYDYGTVAPVHQPSINGAPVNDTTYGPNANISTGANNGYYGLALNPFIDSIATLQSHFQLSPKASLDIEPYFWYGYGTGGNQLQTLTEGLSAANCGTSAKAKSCNFGGGIGDVNGDGNRADKIYVYEGSVTKTRRPGITSKFNFQLDNQRFLLGYWYEHAHHQQTAPFVTIDNNGQPQNAWLDNPDQWIRTANGQPLEYRNTMTISTGKSAFAQDNISLMQDKLNLQLGVRDSSINRDFHNYASAGGGDTSRIGGSGADYTVNETYHKTLPSFGARYQFNDANSAFFNVAENFRAPGNYDYFNLLAGTPASVGVPANTPYYGPNGLLTNYVQRPVVVQAETSVDYDLGYRYATDRMTFSGSLYYIDFHNRIASAYIEELQTSVDQNVGDVHQYGVEMESGYKLAKDWSLYGSLSYMKTRMLQDLDVGPATPATVKAAASPDLYLPTTGKQMPDTPNWLAAMQLSYTHDQFDSFIEAKYTGKRYTSLVNDDAVSGYTVVNLGGGYKFAPASFFKTPTVRFNILNLFNSHYLSMTGPSGSSYANNAYSVATPNGVIAPGKPLVNGIPAASQFYVGAPRSYTISISSDF